MDLKQPKRKNIRQECKKVCLLLVRLKHDCKFTVFFYVTFQIPAQNLKMMRLRGDEIKVLSWITLYLFPLYNQILSPSFVCFMTLLFD
jgi:hypothetical protein